jgi:hypothetical protein
LPGDRQQALHLMFLQVVSPVIFFFLNIYQYVIEHCPGLFQAGLLFG